MTFRLLSSLVLLLVAAIAVAGQRDAQPLPGETIRAAAAALPRLQSLLVSRQGKLLFEYILVFRDLDLVVVTTSSTAVSDERRDHRRQIFEIVERHIIGQSQF